MNNNENFLNEDELSELDRFKSGALLQAINECNMYTQTGALIVMADSMKNKANVLIRPTTALYIVMDYLNKAAIPREALIEAIFNLIQFVQDKNLQIESFDFQKISFTINTLHQILLENSYFKIFGCKKGFIPKLSLNREKIKIKKGQMLYLLDRDWYLDPETKQNVLANVIFAVETGIWYYLLDEEMQYLKGESYKK